MTVLAAISLLIALYLVTLHGRFWRTTPLLRPAQPRRPFPSVTVVVPARNEAPLLRDSLGSLLAQDYPGPCRVILVDDDSTDGTAAIGRGFDDPRLLLVPAAARPVGWTGKLWAVSQGLAWAGDADLVLLSDADIVHDRNHLSALVARQQDGDLDLVSAFVGLHCQSPAERALVPAFVFFFGIWHPFAWVNDPRRRTAGAYGGTILLHRRALERTRGMDAIRGAIIDDVALGKAVKAGGPIWLCHSTLARSARSLPRTADVFGMIARYAYVQLGTSPAILAGAVTGACLTWMVPPAAALLGQGPARALGVAAWSILACAYVPTLRLYRRSLLWAPFLPMVAAFYAAAAVASAMNHHRGRGVEWKGRTYRASRGGRQDPPSAPAADPLGIESSSRLV